VGGGKRARRGGTKTVGIIGGIGPESTIEYYRLAIALYRERTGDGSHPSILIDSIDLRRILALVEADRRADLTVFRPETRARFLAIVERMKAQDDVDGVILGGTELPLLLRDQEHAGVPLLDTTRIHVEEIVDRMCS